MNIPAFRTLLPIRTLSMIRMTYLKHIGESMPSTLNHVLAVFLPSLWWWYTYIHKAKRRRRISRMVSERAVALSQSQRIKFRQTRYVVPWCVVHDPHPSQSTYTYGRFGRTSMCRATITDNQTPPIGVISLASQQATLIQQFAQLGGSITSWWLL